MAYRAAVANGNWSSTSTWNGGVLPAAGDVIASNGFTVTIDQNVNVDSITNVAVTSINAIPIMTSNTTPSGIASSSGIWTNNLSYAEWYAFASSGSGYLGNNTGCWLAYEFTSAKIINSYSFGVPINSSSNSMKDWTFEGWTGSSWVVLHTVTNNLAASWASGYTSPSIGNTTAYIKYRVNATSSNTGASYISINTFKMIETLSVTAVAGGTFNLNSGVTVTCTGSSGIYAGINTCLTYAGTGTSTINGNINALTVSPASYTYTLVHSGTGILNINGNLNANGSCGNKGCLTLTGSGTLNLVGGIGGGFCNSPNVSVTTSGKLNVIGGIYGGSNVTALDLAGTSVTTITGNLYGGSNTGRPIIIGATAVLTITGDLLYGDNSGPALRIDSGTPNITIIGNVGSSFGNATILLTSVAASYIKVIGTIYAGLNYNFYSTSPSAINILTGPFISYSTGVHPFLVARMHYLRTIGSYVEFRDNSTNGAIPPAASAPATRLVSPSTAVDAPSPANVRYGTSYSLGSQTGTMIVPNPANVVKNVPVDNTVGTGALDPSAIWAVPLSALTTNNSIGQVVKKVATVETTGAQIQSTLNNNP